jgi:hypothetical protein
MKRWFAGFALLGSLTLQSSSVRAADVSIHVSIPPPPHVIFETQPEVVIVPQTRVEYVPVVTDYDMYRYEKYWYVNRDGYWYRSHSYRGPFRYVEYRSLPHAVVVVPAEYRHHPEHPKQHKTKPDKHHH